MPTDVCSQYKSLIIVHYLLIIHVENVHVLHSSPVLLLLVFILGIFIFDFFYVGSYSTVLYHTVCFLVGFFFSFDFLLEYLFGSFSDDVGYGHGTFISLGRNNQPSILMNWMTYQGRKRGFM